MKRILTAIIGLLIITNTTLLAQIEQDPGVDDAFIHEDDLPLMNIGHQFRLIFRLTNNGNDPISGVAPDNISFTIDLEKCAPHVGGVVTANGMDAISGPFLAYFDVTYSDAEKRYTAVQKPGVEFPGIGPTIPMDIQINVVVTALSVNMADFSVGAVFELTPPAGATENNPLNDIAEVFASTASLLPVTLSVFDGSVNACNVVLNWETSMETNFSHFELQYSENGTDFTTIKNIPAVSGAGAKKYQTSITQNAATAYYRLKMVDLDNTFSYSGKVLQFRTNCNNDKITLFPNPVVNDRVTISGIPQKSIIQIHHIDGKLLETVKPVQSVHQINMSRYARGSYLITVIHENKVHQTFKVVKQ